MATHTIHLYFDEDNDEFTNFLEQHDDGLFLFAVFTKPIPGTLLEADFHKPGPKGQYHVHINDKNGNEVLSVNKDGSAHHRVNKGKQVHPIVADYLRKKGYEVSSDNILKVVQLDSKKKYHRITVRISGNDVWLKIGGLIQRND
ncbi:hypothetical protein GC096_30385 [Paenibacillus sp. LMG 31461]|uniref:Uncharacterized protein n=1 Tax=Paenibacillus plantarum TaxID=2654975 RepID=A0ABX1XIG9_9BACL|nr:hypothetical protein [Paenibacillus plantarum]NOU68338.1 hypothetical protein [Paenibacillus plantarum]